MERRVATDLMATLDRQIKALEPGEPRTALKTTFDALCRALDPNLTLRRNHELDSDWN